MEIQSGSKLIPLGVIDHASQTILVYREIGEYSFLRIAVSTDGTHFKLNKDPLIIAKTVGNEKLEQCDHFKFSVVNDEFIISYERKSGAKVAEKKHEIVFANSKNLKKFKVFKSTSLLPHSGFIIPWLNEDKKKENALYHGTPHITVAYSRDLETWKTTGALLISPRAGFFDRGNLFIISSHSTTAGIAVLYECRTYERGKEWLVVGGALFAHHDPSKLIWRSEAPLWEEEYDTTDAPHVCGSAFKKDTIILYISLKNGELLVIDIPNIFKTIGQRKHGLSFVHRHPSNPIIDPTPVHNWQSQGTFNPAAVNIGGRTHVLYRALGNDGISRLGYASSKSGTHFDHRQHYPAYEPHDGFGLPDQAHRNGPRRYDAILYTSGGGWGGCEDPRMVEIDGRIYVTFNVFESWGSIRVAVISIDEKDFVKHDWTWTKPITISPANEVNKNWVLFPEKINGKFAILHDIWPRIGIEYVKNLEDLKNGKKALPKFWHRGAAYPKMPASWIHINQGTPGSVWVDPKELAQNVWGNKESRSNDWDTWIRSVGAPPIKTSKGWLVLYHATDKKEPSIGYKVGALLLDLEHPEKIIAHSPTPIISPDKWYENDWKPGVVYVCGAVIKGKNLMVYYGGGDKHVCLAEIPLNAFLDWLLKNGKIATT